MEWDEDEGSPQNRKFWSEGPDIIGKQERKHRSPEARSPGYNKNPHAKDNLSPHSRNGPRSPGPENPSFRDDKHSPGSPSSRPRIPLDQNMPKGITYDPFHGYRNDPRDSKVQEQEKASPRERYNERHRDPRVRQDRHRENHPQSDPRQRYPSDDSRQGPTLKKQMGPFNSRSGTPKDSFNKYASERPQRDSRSRYPEDMERYRSRSADKHEGGRDSRSHFSDENSSHFGARDSRSGYSEDSDQQRRSRRRDPTDGLPAIPKEHLHNINRRHRDSDRRYERQRPKSEHLEHYDPRNGYKHVDNPMYNQERQPPTDYRGAAYDRQPELIQKSNASPQQMSPVDYSGAAYDHKQKPTTNQELNDREQYDSYHGQVIYDPFHGYQKSPPENRKKQPEVEYSKINKVRKGHAPEGQPDENQYMQMNSNR